LGARPERLDFALPRSRPHISNLQELLQLNQPSKTIPEDKVLVRGARQLLTLQGSEDPRRGGSLGELCIIPDGAVLIRGCAITEVGTSRRVENLKDARGAREIDATGRVVMPGFVDAGAQLVQVQPHLDAYESMLRGAAEPQAAGDIPPHRAASARRLEGHVRKLIERLVRHGTTTIGAKSGGPEPAEDLKMLRVLSRLKRRPLDIVTSYFGANHIPPEFTNNVAGYLEWIARNILHMIARRKLASFVGIQCDQQTFGNRPLIEYLKQAHKLGLGVEILAGCETAARLALETEAVSLHIGRVQPGELKLLAESSTIAVLAPASVLYHEPRSFADASVDRFWRCGRAGFRIRS